MEALALSLGLGLLLLITLPAWSGVTKQSGLAACANNLRQIGQALRLWAHDHGDEMPWRVPRSEGGSQPDDGVKPGAAWIEYYYLADHLPSPRVLACPSDATRRVAQNWGTDENGGLLNAFYRDAAVSYVIGLETQSEFGFGILSGDRNLRYDFEGFTCSARINNTVGFGTFRNSTAGWTNAIHGLVGNVLLPNGAVDRTSTEEFRDIIAADDFDNGGYHLLAPVGPAR